MKGLKIIWVYCIFALILATISVTAAPSATSVKVLPESPNAGQELICNYTYMHPSNYTEQNSSYEWWKNGVNQNINNQILAKSNLTPGDNWYCKVTPNDGVSLGTKQQSSNTVTILNATLNPVFYVNGVAVWNESGYFGSRTNVLGLNQEFASGLGSCVPDEEGYCNITLTFYSGNNGILNLTDMMVYYLNYTIDIEPKNDSESCSSGSECLSNYCDGDGAGLADDNWCFTPYSTYFDGQENTYCEFSTGTGISDCDERTSGTELDKCIGTSYYEEECSSSCGYQDITSVFECTDTGCSCSESLCDGQTTGSSITTCSSGQTYFADKCTSAAAGEDRTDNICRSSSFAAGCTADAECNGVEAGTNDCTSSCVYNPDNPPSVTLVSPSDNNVNTSSSIIFSCSATDDINLANMTLYHNVSGTWQSVETKALSGTSDSETFTVSSIPDETSFIWNCLAYDTASQSDWGNANYTIKINLTQTAENLSISSLQSLYSDNTLHVFEIVVSDRKSTRLNSSH